MTVINPYYQRDDCRWRRVPLAVVRDKGVLRILLLSMVLYPQGQYRPVGGPTLNHSRQRPLKIHIHRGNHCRHDSMTYFVTRGKRGLGEARASLISFWSLVLCQPLTKHRVETSLDFMECANKRPSKRGCHKEQNRCHSPLIGKP